MTEDNITFSSSPEDTEKKRPPVLKKYVIALDNLRLVGYALPEDDPEYSEDTFDIVNSYLHKDGDFLSSYAEDVRETTRYASAEKPFRIELRYSHYRTEQVVQKK